MISGGEKLFNWGDIKREIVEETPDERGFKDCYTERQIDRDLQKVYEIKEKLGISPEVDIPDSRIQEYAIAQEIGEMDWFFEESQDGLFEDNKGAPTAVFLTSEYDDYVHHIDAICLMDNACSDFKPVPFALDMTYNIDPEGLDKKMSWPHPDRSVGAPGLMTAKYFEDTFNAKPLLKKGKIEIMPRFVIGFNPELSNEITELRMTNSGWDSLKRDELSAKARWCVLKELKHQSGQMLEYLESNREGSPLLETAYTQIKALDEYFGGAIEAAREFDKNEGHPEREDYVERDEVAGAILARNIYK